MVIFHLNPQFYYSVFFFKFSNYTWKKPSDFIICLSCSCRNGKRIRIPCKTRLGYTPRLGYPDFHLPKFNTIPNSDYLSKNKIKQNFDSFTKNKVPPNLDSFSKNKVPPNFDSFSKNKVPPSLPLIVRINNGTFPVYYKLTTMYPSDTKRFREIIDSIKRLKSKGTCN